MTEFVYGDDYGAVVWTNHNDALKLVRGHVVSSGVSDGVYHAIAQPSVSWGLLHGEWTPDEEDLGPLEVNLEDVVSGEIGVFSGVKIYETRKENED